MGDGFWVILSRGISFIRVRIASDEEGKESENDDGGDHGGLSGLLTKADFSRPRDH